MLRSSFQSVNVFLLTETCNFFEPVNSPHHERIQHLNNNKNEELNNDMFCSADKTCLFRGFAGNTIFLCTSFIFCLDRMYCLLQAFPALQHFLCIFIYYILPCWEHIAFYRLWRHLNPVYFCILYLYFAWLERIVFHTLCPCHLCIFYQVSSCLECIAF